MNWTYFKCSDCIFQIYKYLNIKKYVADKINTIPGLTTEKTQQTKHTNKQKKPIPNK